MPTEGMPGRLEACANNQPITLAVDTVRALLDQTVGTEGWRALAWCVGILLFVPISVSLYGRVAKR